MNKSVLGAIGRRVPAADRREMRNLIETIITDLVNEKCSTYFSNEEKMIATLRTEVEALRKRIESHECKSTPL